MTARENQELERIESLLYESRYQEAFDLIRNMRRSAGDSISARALYAGACALFGLGHVLEAEEWVERHGERSRYDSSHLFLAAYLELHRRRVDQALLLWTRIIQLNPADTFADSLIERSRRGEALLDQELRGAASFTRFVPLPGAAPGPSIASGPRPLSPYWKLALPALLLVLASLAAGFYFRPLLILIRGDRFRAAEDALPLPPAQGSVLPADSFQNDPPRFVYATRDEALAEYKEARSLIGAGKVNQARMALGRLELSNASFEIKERALLLRDAIPLALAADELRDSVTPAALVQDPYMLRGAQVDWSGRAADVRRSGPALSLRLLLEGPLQAEIHVLLPGADGQTPPPLENGATVRVFGDLASVRGQRIQIYARSIESGR
ncbi:MAG: hypothetical protein K1X75_06835 [Leptospirales bacterium]|nr:hypothetical protein [Leptospirales bacterium]